VQVLNNGVQHDHIELLTFEGDPIPRFHTRKPHVETVGKVNDLDSVSLDLVPWVHQVVAGIGLIAQ